MNQLTNIERTVVVSVLWSPEMRHPDYLDNSGLEESDLDKLAEAVERDSLDAIPGGLDSLIPLLEDAVDYDGVSERDEPIVRDALNILRG